MIYGELPTSPVVFAACDREYFKEHAPSLIYSCDKIQKDVHIHICDPTQESFNIGNVINSDTKIRVTYSYNDKGDEGRELRTYYACLRFLVLPNILTHAKKVMTVDVDCMFMNDFEWPEEAAGYFPRDPIPGTVGWEQEGTRVAAGCVYLDERGILIAKAIAERIQEGPMKWFIDQVALSDTFSRIDDSVEIRKFDNKFMDWEFEKGTTIWTGKGPRKYNNPKYVEAKNRFNELHYATTRCWS